MVRALERTKPEMKILMLNIKENQMNQKVTLDNLEKVVEILFSLSKDLDRIEHKYLKRSVTIIYNTLSLNHLPSFSVEKISVLVRVIEMLYVEKHLRFHSKKIIDILDDNNIDWFYGNNTLEE